jgi:hypothetical protein
VWLDEFRAAAAAAAAAAVIQSGVVLPSDLGWCCSNPHATCYPVGISKQQQQQQQQPAVLCDVSLLEDDRSLAGLLQLGSFADRCVGCVLQRYPWLFGGTLHVGLNRGGG